MKLPTEKIKAETSSPLRLFIYSKPKVGKTEAVAQLADSLLIDLQKGSKYVDAVKVYANDLVQLKEVLTAIKEAGKPYKYLIIDTVTDLEDMALGLALKLYKATPMGANFKGDNVLTLPNGGGYMYLRDAMKKITDSIEECAERIIYLGHIKEKSIEKNGKEVSASDIDLTGKVRSSMSANVDTIGMLYRDGNKNILSFLTKDEVICGSRSPHLSNQEIVLSEKIDGKLVTYWDRIYVD